MTDTIKKFGFIVRGGLSSKPGEMSVPPVINLNLRRWTALSDDRNPVISPELISEAEIEEYVKQLHEDLDVTKDEAKKALRKKQIEPKSK